jgi:succinate dehydrogenase flavin-adding protein (antitoxin of CptAB toxin-antitoxin module)
MKKILLLVTLLLSLNANEIYKEGDCVSLLLGDTTFNKNKMYDRSCIASFITKNINAALLIDSMKMKVKNLKSVTSENDIIIYNYVNKEVADLTDVEISKRINFLCNNESMRVNLLGNNLKLQVRYELQNITKVIDVNQSTCDSIPF